MTVKLVAVGASQVAAPRGNDVGQDRSAVIIDQGFITAHPATLPARLNDRADGIHATIIPATDRACKDRSAALTTHSVTREGRYINRE